MDKRRLYHYSKSLHRVRPTYLLVALVMSLGVSAFALRENNLHMLKLRSAVMQADKMNGNVEQALKNLRQYVYGHMNTNLASGQNAIYPPVQLKYTYERLVEAEQKKAAAANSKVYTEAQNYCQRAIPNGFSGRYRVSCIQQYVTVHGVQPVKVPASLYKFDFASPRWSPDLAGWSLVVSGVLLLSLVLRLIIGLIMDRILSLRA